MEQRDYLVRQAEQLGQVLGKILLKLFGLKDTATMETVNDAFREESDFDVDRLIDIDEERWLDTLKEDKRLNPSNLEKLADILLFAADNASPDDRNQLYRKCLMIYEYLDESERTYSFDRNHKIERIRKCIWENEDN